MKKLALAVFGSALLLSSTASAQTRNVVTSSPYVSNQAFDAPDNFRVNYFAGLMSGAVNAGITGSSSLASTDNGNDNNPTPVTGATSPDEYLDIVNPGSDGADPGSAVNGIGDLCALIYVVDTYEELEECCGCLVTPDQLIELSVQKDLLANPDHNRVVRSGSIKIISSAPSVLATGGTITPVTGSIAEYHNASCDPGAPIPTPTLREWITHVRTIPGLVPVTGVTEVEFSYAPLSGTAPGPGTSGSGEEGFLASQCANIRTQSTGAGRCNCPVGPGGNNAPAFAQ
jgi:hypothetical protein